MSRLKALIFDVDGTLAETEEVHRQAFNEAFKAFGIDLVWDQSFYGELLVVSGGKQRLLHYAAHYPSDIADRIVAAVNEIHARKTQIYSKMIDDRRARLRPGVERILEEARGQGIRLALASTSSLANAEALIIANLEVSGLDQFEVIVGGDDIAAKKPAPDIYLSALEKLGLPADRCLAVEDSEQGVKAALAAGLRCIVTPSTYTAGGDFTGALAVLSHLGDAFDPYEHIAGAGDRDRMVTMAALRRWIADDDDMRSLLTIGGKPVW